MNKPTASGHDSADLLIELGCEELPPRSLPILANTLFSGFSAQLEKAGLTFDATSSRVFYTPRRLALLMSDVAASQPDQVLQRKGPAISAAFDAQGHATAAALGFARSVGKSVDDLETLKTEKGEWLYCRVKKAGEQLENLLFPMLEKSLAALPVAKPMRWGSNEFTFIRPVHWLVAMHGEKIISGGLFGLPSGGTTCGHRVHHPGPHRIGSVNNYEKVLTAACVMVDQDKRQQTILHQVVALGKFAGGQALIDENLLEEVSNLVEWPHAILGSFDPEFLTIPAEALIASMQGHQKFFPVIGADSGPLLNRFIAIVNLESADIDAVRAGFERVIRPRLADARFFWEQDNKSSIEDWLPALDNIVFQNKLGSVGDKSRRIALVSEKLAEEIKVDQAASQRAARLCKCDLVSQMVGEFPELQGIMGRYYAERSGENEAVFQAIGDHYLPAFSGDRLPEHAVGKVVALADRLDTLTGIFAIGLKPSGNKDPFALRRSALGAIRILLEGDLPIELDKALAISAQVIQQQLPLAAEIRPELRLFILERLKQYLREKGYATSLINAVFDAPIGTLPDLVARLGALRGFMALDVSSSLVSANKRIGNILRKSDDTLNGKIKEDRFVIEEEVRLFADISNIKEKLEHLYEAADYAAALDLLAGLSSSIDAFFEQVLVMDDNDEVRLNRLNLLAKLKAMFDRVANLALIG